MACVRRTMTILRNKMKHDGDEEFVNLVGRHSTSPDSYSFIVHHAARPPCIPQTAITCQAVQRGLEETTSDFEGALCDRHLSHFAQGYQLYGRPHHAQDGG